MTTSSNNFSIPTELLSEQEAHTPAYLKPMQSTAPSGSLEKFKEYQDFPLDPFQSHAAEKIEQGRGVLVCAPTGAGKTIVGEYAAFNAIENGTHCFYTTPIKALSNQKYNDFVEFYGEENIGLLTGDTSINPEAPIVVMTTEILRNMQYTESVRLDKLSHVVMDEVHYLADESRGAVWEETILNLDSTVTLVALSATVSNSEEFGQWLGTVRSECDIIITDKRPVPLDQYMMVGSKIIPLFNEEGKTNPSLHKAIALQEKQGKTRPIKRADAIKTLAASNILPAIYFIFSRAACDDAVRQLIKDGLDFTSAQEKSKIEALIDEQVHDIPAEDLRVLGFGAWKRALSRGIAAHHAGMLPAFRHIVEKLFVQGHLKVVFATETLALGINMPARTVVIEKITKFNGEAHVDLTPAQYSQLTGRAGRRGIDTLGNAVVLWNESVDPRYVSQLAGSRSYPLNSIFKPGYNMAVNLLNTKGYIASHELLQRSFAQYQQDGSIVDHAEQLAEKTEALAEAQDALRAEIDRITNKNQGLPDDFEDIYQMLLEYSQLRYQLNQAEKAARSHSHNERSAEITRFLSKLKRGDVVALPTGKNPELSAVVQPAGHPNNPAPIFVTEKGWSGRLGVQVFGNTPVLVGHMRLPGHPRRITKKITQAIARQLRKSHFDKPKKIKQVADSGHSKEVTTLRNQLHNHPVYSWYPRESLAHAAQQVLKAQRSIDFIEEQMNTRHNLGNQFDAHVGLLTEYDYVESPDYTVGPASLVTEEGIRLADIHHELDLLIAQALRRGIWDGLDPAELAAVASTVSFENRREKQGNTTFPSEAVEKAIADTKRVYSEITTDEQRYSIASRRDPDTSFALALHQWTSGAPLDYCLKAAHYSGTELTIGDFVRSTRQAIEILEQIARSGYSPEIKRNARKAIAAMTRGVVELSV